MSDANKLAQVLLSFYRCAVSGHRDPTKPYQSCGNDCLNGIGAIPGIDEYVKTNNWPDYNFTTDQFDFADPVILRTKIVALAFGCDVALGMKTQALFEQELGACPPPSTT